VVANNIATDFALLRLTESPVSITGYLGWDRSLPVAGGVGIHHPREDVKKISTYTMTPVTATCMTTSYFAVNFWKVNWVQTTTNFSVMQPGSSGSPLLSSEHRVIGQLYGPGSCGDIQCENPSAQTVKLWKILYFVGRGWSNRSSTTIKGLARSNQYQFGIL
jgi:S1-C subfamily serine protease